MCEPSISTCAYMKTRSGLDWLWGGVEREAANLSSFGWQLVWLTRCLSDLSVCFELITKLYVCNCMQEEGGRGRAEKNDNQEGTGDVKEKSRVSGFSDTVSSFSRSPRPEFFSGLWYFQGSGLTATSQTHFNGCGYFWRIKIEKWDNFEFKNQI